MSHSQVALFSLVLFLLIACSAFFSCAETALMAVNRYRLRHKARLKRLYAIRLLQLLKRPDRLLSVLLIGNTFANILASSLATMIGFSLWGERGALLAAMVLTFVILIFSEIAPKTIAALYPEKVARWVVYPVQVILRIFNPVVMLANSIANYLLQLLRIPVTNHVVEPLSRDELRSVVHETAGKISRQYQNMLLGILDLNNLTVDDVMVPRHEMVGVDFEQPWEVIVKQLNKIQQDWIPIYKESANHLLGVLCARDVMQLLLGQQKVDKEALQPFLQEPYFVPEGTSLQVQLSHFQQNHDKIAFVVDEYGEILGMLTLNDILEEIVGDFSSSVTIGKYLQVQPDGSYLVDGSMTVREFNRATQWELPVRGPRTLNGLIVEYLEALPKVGTAVLIAGYPLEILKVKDNRVKMARVFARIENYTT